MSEDRIKVLEKQADEVKSRLSLVEQGQSQVRHDLSELAVAQKDSFLQQALMEKSMGSLITTLGTQHKDNERYATAIDSIDNNIRLMALAKAGEPMERMRETQSLVNPVWDKIHENGKRISGVSEAIKTELRRELRVNVTLVVLLVGVIAGVATYTYTDTIGELRDRVNQNHNILRAAP